MSKLRVVIADDHASLRESLARYLDSEADLSVVGEAADGEEALSKVRELKPDVLLLDLTLPRLSGVQVLQALAKEQPQSTRTVVLSMHASSSYIQASFDAGAMGYLTKEASASEVVKAIRSVSQGARVLRPPSDPNRRPIGLEPVVSAKSPSPQLNHLSARELEVLTQLAHGYTSKEIAAHLDVTKATVDTYRARLTEKLGVRGRGELVRIAVQAGLIARA